MQRIVLGDSGCFSQRGPKSVTLFDAFLGTFQVACQDRVFFGSPNIKWALSEVLVCCFIPSATKRARPCVNQTRSTLKVVETRADLPVPRTKLIQAMRLSVRNETLPR
jgi:hypothetical protein